MNQTLRKIEPLFHLTFWVLLFFTLFSSINDRLFSAEEACLITLLRISLLIFIAYFHAFILIPTLFRKGRFVWYSLSIILLLIVAAKTHQSIFQFFIQHFDFLTIQRPRQRSFLQGRYGHFLFTFFNLMILFISAVYALGKELLKKEQKNARLEQEKIKHELNFLRSQINPHFLFNALNNIYATVQLKPEQAGDFILKLSDMLRYVLEDCKKDRVSLADEIQYLNNYIFFQQQKDDQLQQVQFTITGDNPNLYDIEPMLFIALVENAFIHSYTENVLEQYIFIDLHINSDELHFATRNNIGTTDATTPSKRQHGLGIANIQRRLDLLYPNQYEFTYGIQNKEYQVKLIIKE